MHDRLVRQIAQMNEQIVTTGGMFSGVARLMPVHGVLILSIRAVGDGQARAQADLSHQVALKFRNGVAFDPRGV